MMPGFDATLIPPLTNSLRKGDLGNSGGFQLKTLGRIAVVGGSLEYTGAPFYAAMAALNTVRLSLDVPYLQNRVRISLLSFVLGQQPLRSSPTRRILSFTRYCHIRTTLIVTISKCKKRSPNYLSASIL